MFASRTGCCLLRCFGETAEMFPTTSAIFWFAAEACNYSQLFVKVCTSVMLQYRAEYTRSGMEQERLLRGLTDAARTKGAGVSRAD